MQEPEWPLWLSVSAIRQTGHVKTSTVRVATPSQSDYLPLCHMSKQPPTHRGNTEATCLVSLVFYAFADCLGVAELSVAIAFQQFLEKSYYHCISPYNYPVCFLCQVWDLSYLLFHTCFCHDLISFPFVLQDNGLAFVILSNLNYK